MFIVIVPHCLWYVAQTSTRCHAPPWEPGSLIVITSHITWRHCTVQYSTLHGDTVQYSTLQYSTLHGDTRDNNSAHHAQQTQPHPLLQLFHVFQLQFQQVEKKMCTKPVNFILMTIVFCVSIKHQTHVS